MTTRVELRHVRDVMNDDPTKVSADTPLEEIVQLFARYGYDGFPVVDGTGALVGIVTKLDVLGALRPVTMRGQPARLIGMVSRGDLLRAFLWRETGDSVLLGRTPPGRVGCTVSATSPALADSHGQD